jgi:hypothetical protein
MELPKHINLAAAELLKKGSALPVEIPNAPGFHLGEADDSTIQSFGGIVEDGVSYKIGVRKPE